MAKKYNRDMPLPSSNNMFGGPGNPKKTKADSLKAQSNIKKNRAELLANKAKKTTNVWPETRYTPEGREYMVAGKVGLTEKSNLQKASAKSDSIKAEVLYKSAKPTKKLPKTADSTDYYKRRMMSNMEMEFRSKGELKEIYRKKFNRSVDDLSRQKRKGKPGYDKNGFPVKKKN